MREVKVVKATLEDASCLTEVMKLTFDEEARRWLSEEKEIIDFNIQPPGYASVERMRYSIEKLHTYKVIVDGSIQGGVILSITGQTFGRIDRIFIAPLLQGQGIGSKVMRFIEDEYKGIRIWELETSSRQKGNLQFYEGHGYKRVFEADDECCYEKRVAAEETSNLNKLYEHLELHGVAVYGANLSNSSISNSNLEQIHYTNCNMRQSEFRNINFRQASFADLNLARSKFEFVSLGGVHFNSTDLGEGGMSISFKKCDLREGTIEQCDLRDLKIVDSKLGGMTINGIRVDDLLAVYEERRKKENKHI
ncbi:GNAT family N-acetyltransferase [Pontibacillus sp. ALD_SL1]|uniref:GNAT family N-acetyltransferase n=1 Tax=Pontibacillus sp. ALD_SL1 TaxID=2777185 RepID=UPI001A96D940|nr:GNAT family N-acetyltransferase [Pontibacillus sp. ALD_SL1]QSS98719.1 GNAT family N-acetyltransferase [Pontibacillus sp. ALD_SL1]